jgi:hypothetical protein
MEKLYSLSFNRFIEIISFSFFSSKPIWFKNIIRQLIKKLNINLSNFEVPDSDTKLLFENDDIFISTLLGFKPFSSVNNDIEKIYKQFNYPSSVPKLLKLVKSAGITATSNDIKTFLDKRTAIQQTKITKKSRKNMGHIVSFKSFDILNS